MNEIQLAKESRRCALWLMVFLFDTTFLKFFLLSFLYILDFPRVALKDVLLVER